MLALARVIEIIVVFYKNNVRLLSKLRRNHRTMTKKSIIWEEEIRATQVQAAAPVQPAAVNNDATNIEALEKLAKLHEQGILTDDEFQQKKSELLTKI